MKEEAWGWGKGGHRLTQMGRPLLGTVPGPHGHHSSASLFVGTRGPGEAFG